MLLAPASPKHVLADLRNKIDTLEGAPRRFGCTISICDIVDAALPSGGLPLGCVHELKGNPANTIAFAGLLSTRIPRQGPILFIEPNRTLYPLGLLPYGVDLARWIHVRARKPKDLVWTVLEALRCSQVSAVLAAMPDADLTFSRRLQLAAESSGATGFLFGNMASAITRWRVAPIRNFGWSLELLYCRGGKPGSWQLRWRNGQLSEISRPMQREAYIATSSSAGIAAETALAG